LDVLRTPDDRFDGLRGWDHPAAWSEVDVDGTVLRLARVEVGPADGHPIVLLHGEPTWGYLYRDVVGPLAAAGLRCIVPDHPGFGRSDKPSEVGWYSYDRLVASLHAHLDALDLPPVTLVVHDWGGPIGLRWAVEHPERVARLVVLDTGLYAPGGEPSVAWSAFRAFVERTDELPIGMLVDGGCVRELSSDEVAAYEAPFHVPTAQAGARALPLLVPVADSDPGAAEQWRTLQALGEWRAPTVLLWGADDRILPVRIGQRWARSIPGSVGITTFAGAGHFLQEDVGAELGNAITAFVRDQPV
jgi:haloalkane dehalogenase